ncbi:NUDIX domain-containing protein [Streptacidiphilus jiangxiensis]|uniref:8-oxo-dGTP diphosphatase n=1 Tax=Streptacidiphilus jiangxiensis TaxID=235985 RepID=A0A1H7MV06_STRJI|nr:NUDIX domain-containing protein [Streptacidiphilus jiangxiensis]SEL14638.1 8-oxo-dGTP diphosphatase [Streptacidiphilus jiangxiensis]
MDGERNGPRVSARAVLVDPRGRILLVRHHDGTRDFHVLPGGRLELGETAEEAVRREVLEETGHRVRVLRLLWVREFLPERHLGHPLHSTSRQQLQLVFQVEQEQEQEPGPQPPLPLRPDRTQTALVWHPLADLADLTLLPLGLTAELTALAAGRPTRTYLGDLA